MVSLMVLTVALTVALVVAVIPAGCTLGICARNSECATGQVCTTAGACAIPADASTDGQAGDAGSNELADAPTDAAPDADLSGGGAP
jgi:hypothetical protein